MVLTDRASSAYGYVPLSGNRVAFVFIIIMFIDRLEAISVRAQTILSHFYPIPTVDCELSSTSAREFLVYYYFVIDVQPCLPCGMLRS